MFEKLTSGNAGKFGDSLKILLFAITLTIVVPICARAQGKATPPPAAALPQTGATPPAAPTPQPRATLAPTPQPPSPQAGAPPVPSPPPAVPPGGAAGTTGSIDTAKPISLDEAIQLALGRASGYST